MKKLGIPLEHSWLVNKDGLVIDPTLIISGNRFNKQMKKYGGTFKDEHNRIGSEYFGIKFTNAQINKYAIQTKKSGSFIYLLFKERKN